MVRHQIKIEPETKDRLDKLKNSDDNTYNRVIKKLLKNNVSAD